MAFRSALTLKGTGGQVKIVDDFDFPEPSTKSFKGVIDACGLNDLKVLFVTPENASTLVKSSRNIQSINTTHVGSLGTYDVVAADVVLFTRQALDKLVEHHTAVEA